MMESPYVLVFKGIYPFLLSNFGLVFFFFRVLANTEIGLCSMSPKEIDFFGDFFLKSSNLAIEYLSYIKTEYNQVTLREMAIRAVDLNYSFSVYFFNENIFASNIFQLYNTCYNDGKTTSKAVSVRHDINGFTAIFTDPKILKSQFTCEKLIEILKAIYMSLRSLREITEEKLHDLFTAFVHIDSSLYLVYELAVANSKKDFNYHYQLSNKKSWAIKEINELLCVIWQFYTCDGNLYEGSLKFDGMMNYMVNEMTANGNRSAALTYILRFWNANVEDFAMGESVYDLINRLPSYSSKLDEKTQWFDLRFLILSRNYVTLRSYYRTYMGTHELEIVDLEMNSINEGVNVQKINELRQRTKGLNRHILNSVLMKLDRSTESQSLKNVLINQIASAALISANKLKDNLLLLETSINPNVGSTSKAMVFKTGESAIKDILLDSSLLIHPFGNLNVRKKLEKWMERMFL